MTRQWLEGSDEIHPHVLTQAPDTSAIDPTRRPVQARSGRCGVIRFLGYRWIAYVTALAWVFGVEFCQAEVVITEFMAANAPGLRDEQGDASDWIELSNSEAVSVDLTGWRLTDSAGSRSKWRFPVGARIAPLGRLVVFASGKNRVDPSKPLHTNFNLRQEGEYLALFPPEGVVAATEFAPSYPPQAPDISYGVGYRELDLELVTADSNARIAIAAPGNRDRDWVGTIDREPFDDSSWIVGNASAGYDDLTSDVPNTLLGYWNFDEAQQPKVAVDSSGRGNHGTLLGPAVLGPSRSGRSGKVGDRALDLGVGGNNKASVRVDAAARGAFDLIQQRDVATVSLWAYGGPQQPVANSVIWFDSVATTGDSRNLMVHLPWSDSVIYFDTAGCCGGDTRISRQELDTTKWRGRWNHYVFLKDGPRKEIWQNGQLWHRGSSAVPLKAIRSLWLGSAPNASATYPGKLDDIAVWANPLTAGDIQALAQGVSPIAIGSYRSWIRTDLTSVLAGASPVARMRVPFQIPPNFSADFLRLRLRYDDGLSAWINGVPVAELNIPVAASRSKLEALEPVVLDIPIRPGWLRSGQNILALEGVNEAANGSDFLIHAELIAGNFLAQRYFTAPTPLAVNGTGVAGLTAAVGVTPERGFLSGTTVVTLSCSTPGASIYYTLDGSLPTREQAFAVSPAEPNGRPTVELTVSNATVVRVMALRDDFEPSAVQTHTYLFADQVEKQPARIPGYPTTWGVYGAYGPRQGQPVPADYEMDPDVVRTTTAGYRVSDGILSLPAICLTMAITNWFDAKTGIYPNSASQGDQWIRPASAEWILPNGDPGFQIDAGVRIHGGLSRQHWHAIKHSFRLHFQREYGPTRLRFRLFDDSRVTSFNELTLRASSTDGWAVEESGAWPPEKTSYLRDPWMKDTQLAMGWPVGHNRYVNVFLNGIYWGQYNLAERTESVWLAENFGGDPEEYDIIKDGGEVEAGTKTVWDQMIARATSGLTSDTAYWRLLGRRADGTRDPAMPVYLNVDSLIDYMILHIYAGAVDWPNHNWWSARRRGDLSDGFRFFTWDQEISNLSLTSTTTFPGERFEAVSGPPDSPAFLYHKLRQNRLFRERFSARVIALTTGTGILTPTQNAARWERRVAEIDRSIVAESARWGDSRRSVPAKRSDWLKEMSWMRSTYWPGIHSVAIARFRSVGLYTNTLSPAVVITPPGGIISLTVPVSLSGGPKIVYSTNGVDPIAAGSTLAPGASPYTSPFLLKGPTHVRAQRLIGETWSAPVSAFFLQPTAVAAPDSMDVSEVFYFPETVPAEEFIEVHNRSTTRYAILGGGRLSGGIDFTVPNGWILGPGERALAVRNRAAFETRYGADKPVLGEYAGALANDGDWIHLLAPSGRVVSRFHYGDARPWPLLAAGSARSMTRVASPQGLDPTDPRSWRASAVVGGTPGWDDAIPFTGELNQDLDGDGLSAAEEYFLGSNDLDPKSGPDRQPKLLVGPSGEISLSVSHPLGADRLGVVWESSADFVNWSLATDWPQPESWVSGDNETLLWRSVGTSEAAVYYRLRFELR